jgi:hypothetical protein
VALLVQAAVLVLVVAGCGSDPPPPPKEAPKPVVQETAPTPAPAPKPVETEEMTISGEGVLGSLTDDQIQGPIQQRWPEIQKCKQQNKPPWYVGGKVMLHFRIARSGDLKKVTIEESTLGNWTIEKCILTIARSLHFSHPRGGEAEFSYPIEFPARATVRDWDSMQVSADMVKHKKEIAECGKGVGISNRPPPFRLTLYLGPGGKATSVGFSSPDSIDDAFADCVVSRVRTWKFTDPLGVATRASYEFQ